MTKINAGKLLGIAGTIIGIVATLVSEMASSKMMKEEVADEVSKQLAEIKEQ